ncbi:MAG TPA: DUF3798 domain-containing protein [Spirochaetia bacterium]|nr:DUF3798 domain-containing protein [Spirochaetales bacterium]HRS66626.1 DUF3798 domain-containing protein [Spirochaetia bacterium]
MKKSLVLALVLLAAFAVVVMGCPKKEAAKGAAFHIGVVTGSVSQSEDDLRGAEKLIELYGDVKNGGMIKHLTYPDNFMDQMDVTISQIVSLADDPLMKAIVVNQAVPGTAEAFKRVREKRPDILLFAGEPHEDPPVIQEAADVAINSDFIARGYTIIWAAREMGAKKFVHISFPRHMSYETLGLRRLIMEQACKDLGLEFIFETAPDPTTEVGVAGAQQYILEKVPQWIKKYGTDTAFFCTNDAHTEPLLKQLLTYGGYFVEADLPSPLMGYPGALDLDLKAEAGDFQKILKKVEDAIVAKGGAGRFGTWAYSYGFTVTAGLGEYAKMIIEGTAQKGDLAALNTAFAKFTPGANWNSTNYINPISGEKAANHMLVYMDTYVFGKGYLPTTKQAIDQKYFQIKFKK